MPEAFAEPWQEVISKNDKGEEIKENLELNAACNELNVNLISSQPLFQGKLANLELPNKFGVFSHAS